MIFNPYLLQPQIDDLGVLQDDVLVLDATSLNSGGRNRIQLRYPQYVQAGSGNGEFIVTSEKDVRNGLVSFTIKTGEKGEILSAKPEVNNFYLSPKYSYLQNQYGRYRQEIQNATGNVIVNYDGTEYAIVGDFHWLQDNPFWNWDNNYGANKQMGGKLGIIRDPFGKEGEPTFIGSTTPMDFGWIGQGMVDQLTIGADGLLYGDVWTDNPIYNEDGEHRGWRLHKDLFVWDAKELIAMAEAYYLNNDGDISKPFDLKPVEGQDGRTK